MMHIKLYHLKIFINVEKRRKQRNIKINTEDDKECNTQKSGANL